MSRTPGDYTITYSAVDIAGNEATAVRQVTVEPRQYKLTISAFGATSFTSDDGTVFDCDASGGLCRASFDVGKVVTITPTVAAEWGFIGWEACDSVDSEACQVVMDADRLVLSTAARTDPIEIRSDVVALTDEQVDYILNYDPDRDSLIFDRNADLSEMELGDVILAGGGTNEEIYFVRRIVDILLLENAPTIVETIPASLDEVVGQGTLIFELDDPLSAQKSAGSMKDQPNEEHKVDTGVFTLASSAEATVSAGGSVTTSFDPQLAVDVSWDEGLTQFRLAGAASVGAEFGVSITGEGAVSGTVRKELGSYNAGSFTTVVPVGPMTVPLKFVLEMEPFVEGSAGGSFKAGLSPNVNATFTGTTGVQWSHVSGWADLSGYGLSGGVSLGEELESELTLEIVGGMEAGIELYDFVGPKVTGRAYGGAVAKATPIDENGCSLSLKTYGGLSATIGGEIEILSKTLSIESKPYGYERVFSISPSGCDVEPPSAPETVTAVAQSSSEILVSWSEAEDDIGVSFYEVWRLDEQLGRPHLVQETAAPQYLDGGLNAEQEYCYYVIAVDGVDQRSDVPVDLACDTTDPDDVTPPSAPVLQTAEAVSSSAVQLSWDPSTDDVGVAGYTIYDYSVQYPQPFALKQSFETQNTVGRLNPDTEYCFRVTAFDEAGNESDPSNEACTTTFSAEEAEWTIFLGCVGREYILQETLDLDETINSQVEVAGAGLDYPGTALTYVLTGVYETASSQLSADIFWQFENTSQVRQDQFSADLSTGDSGDVTMTQVQVTGCTAQIQIVRTELLTEDVQKVIGSRLKASFYEGLY